MKKKTILITGATGRIGNVLLRELCKEDNSIKLLVRKQSDTSAICHKEHQLIVGDITDRESVMKAMQGVDVVYHLASKIEIGVGNEEKVEKINVGGTENVIDACFKNNVERLVYVGSIHAFREPPEEDLIDEKQPFDPENNRGIYDRTKALASIKVLEAQKKGLDAVIVCPTGVIGPYDHRPSYFGKTMISYIKKPQSMYVKGAYDYVDVRDVVFGMIQAEKIAKSGEVFILGGEQMTMDQFYEYLEEYTGVKAPTTALPFDLLLFIAKVTQLLKMKSALTPYSLKTLRSNSNISHEKAHQKLGYNPRPVKEAIGDQIKWFKEQGMV